MSLITDLFTGLLHKQACKTVISSNESVEITNKMQPCNRIYYTEVY